MSLPTPSASSTSCGRSTRREETAVASSKERTMAAVQWDLEYALLFGVPGNKIELIDGRSRWAFPFVSREQAESHFAHWLQTLARWKGTEAPRVRKEGSRWQVAVGEISMEL